MARRKLIDMKVANIDEVRKALKALGPIFMDKAAKSAQRKVGKELVGHARGRILKHRRFGALDEALMVKTRRLSPTLLMSFVGVNNKVTRTVKIGKRMVTVRPINYAHLLEYGHRIVARGSLKKKVSRNRNGDFEIVSVKGTGSVLGYVQPSPFMRPTLDTKKESAKRLFIRTTQKKILSVVNKARREAGIKTISAKKAGIE